jgi:hypothetical protein
MTKYDVRINEPQRQLLLQALTEFKRRHPSLFIDGNFDTCVLIECFNMMPVDEWHGPGRIHDFTPPDLLSQMQQ